MEISRRLMIELAFFTFIFLASGAFIASFLIPKRAGKSPELDFEGFVRMKERLKVELNGHEYRAEILEELTFEKAKEKCENKSGSLAWNSVKNLSEKITSYWIECGSETDLSGRNLQSHCSEFEGSNWVYPVGITYHTDICLFVIQQWNWQVNASGFLVDAGNRLGLCTQYVCKEEVFDDLGRVRIHTSDDHKIDCEVLSLNSSFISKYKLFDTDNVGKYWTYTENPDIETINSGKQRLLGRTFKEDLDEEVGLRWCSGQPDTSPTGVMWVVGYGSFMHKRYTITYGYQENPSICIFEPV